MFKNIDLFTRRYWQITTVFMLFTFIQKFFHIPHDSWIIITSAMVYSGFNPGTVLKRAYLRFIGTITGIAAVLLVWHLMHLDYRLEITFFMIICFGLAFFAALPYNRYMIIVTMFSDILVESNNPNNFFINYYIVDRFVCTGIVFALCILIEYLWFGKSNMTHLTFEHLRNSLIDDLKELYRFTCSKHMSSSRLSRKIQALNSKIDRLNMLINDSVYEKSFKHDFSPHEIQFSAQTIQVFRKIVNIQYLQSHGASADQLSELHKQTQQAMHNLMMGVI